MDHIMMDNGQIIKEMAKALIFIIMVINIMMEIGKMIKDKEEGNFSYKIRTAINKHLDISMEISITIKLKDL